MTTPKTYAMNAVVRAALLAGTTSAAGLIPLIEEHAPDVPEECHVLCAEETIIVVNGLARGLKLLRDEAPDAFKRSVAIVTDERLGHMWWVDDNKGKARVNFYGGTVGEGEPILSAEMPLDRLSDVIIDDSGVA